MPNSGGSRGHEASSKRERYLIMEVADNLFEDMSSGSNKSWDDDSEDEHPNTGQPGGGHDMGSSDSLSGMREIQENSRSTRDGCWYGRGSVSPASFLVGMSPGLSPGVPGQAGSSEDEFQAKQRAADWGLSPQAAPSMSPGGMGALGVSAELVKEEQPEQQQQQRAFGQTHAEGMQDSTAQGAGSSSQVLLFDEAGSTYMCMIGERNEQIEEFYRLDNQGPWLLVQRADASSSQAHQDAGVPKTINWTGPALVVYTQGKQEIGKGGVLNKPTRKYYQWCQTCCAMSCSSTMRGCTKAKCWVAPRKWKKHCRSQTHISAAEKLRQSLLQRGMAGPRFGGGGPDMYNLPGEIGRAHV